jgi:hypothetical protein
MRGLLRTLVAGATIAAIGACSDTATSPSNATSRSLAPSSRPSLDYDGPSHFDDYRTSTFTLTSNGGTFSIGDNLYTLTVPANAVCVVSSSYGPGTWNSPCTTLKHGQSIKVTATYGFANGGPVVDFSPELRFNPNTPVTISTSLYAESLTYHREFFERDPDALRGFGIYFVTSLGGKTITDAASDLSLVTHINLTTGLVWRRVKHFSGYNVATGLTCDVVDPNCVAVPPIIDGL